MRTLDWHSRKWKRREIIKWTRYSGGQSTIKRRGRLHWFDELWSSATHERLNKSEQILCWVLMKREIKVDHASAGETVRRIQKIVNIGMDTTWQQCESMSVALESKPWNPSYTALGTWVPSLGMTLYTVSQKRDPDVIDCNFEKD